MDDRKKGQELVPVAAQSGRLLTSEEFKGLAAVPPEIEWFANIENANTRRAYKVDVRGFMEFCGIQRPEEFRLVSRSHIIAWRGKLKDSGSGPTTIRRKLSALSSLFDHLCEANAITHNPANGVKRPRENSNIGRTPALSDAQARRLIEAPMGDSLKAVRDRAILAALLYHGLRRNELCGLRVCDMELREGVMHFRILGKGDKIRYVVAHPRAISLINEYLNRSGHVFEDKGAMFRPIRNTRTGNTAEAITPDAIYKLVTGYGKKEGVYFKGMRPHSLRATAATNALLHDSDIAKVQDWLGHASISTTRLYDKRSIRPEDSPTLRVKY